MASDLHFRHLPEDCLSVSTFTGFVRCLRNPASRLLARSSSIPYPVRSIPWNLETVPEREFPHQIVSRAVRQAGVASCSPGSVPG